MSPTEQVRVYLRIFGILGHLIYIFNIPNLHSASTRLKYDGTHITEIYGNDVYNGFLFN